MHKLRHIPGAPSEYLNAIINKKEGDRRVVLDLAKPRVIARYGVFEACYSKASLAAMPEDKTWSVLEVEGLLHCYTSTANALASLKGLIKSGQRVEIRDICPYCGIGASAQFDHYLPKTLYPELSVHSYNLVPCCGPCNGIKSETWLSGGGARVFLNLYLDSLPTAPVVVPSISWITRSGMLLPQVDFTLKRPAGFSAGDFSLIESHFTRLNLLTRYKDQSFRSTC